ncbi:MAG: type II toxin-antitoxin system Y4mF family antitoxin [Akkermansia sp.]
MTPAEIGQLIRAERKRQQFTQRELAGLCGVGLRFVVELEAGKTTAQIGKTLHILQMLGLKITIAPKYMS